MEDVARRAGVALGTVSNAVNNPHLVSPNTLQRVQAAILELGFVPNRRARALAAGASTTIGFVITDLSNSFFLDMARGAEREAERSGYNVLLADADRRIEKELVFMNIFDEERVAGILVAPHPKAAQDVLSRQWGPVVVPLNADGGPGRCSVLANNEVGGYLAARHLVEQGRQHIVFAGGPATLGPVVDRLHGAQRAMSEAAGARFEFYETHGVRERDGRALGRAIADLPIADRPDGVVAASDLLALGTIQALHAESALRVPVDIAVVGYDNNSATWDSPVPITSLDQLGSEMGKVALRLLLDEISSSDEHQHRHISLEPALVVRESSHT